MGVEKSEAHLPPAAERQLGSRTDGPGAADQFAAIVGAYRDYLLAIANQELPSDVRPKVAPSDVVQDSIIEACRSFRQFTGETPSELRVWLRGILKHNLVDATRRYRGTNKRNTRRELPLDPVGASDAPRIDLSDSIPSPSAEVRTTEDAIAVAAVLATLSDDHRRVIELRNFEERSFIEIGQLMNRSPNAARKLWARAIKGLGVMLSDGETDAPRSVEDA